MNLDILSRLLKIHSTSTCFYFLDLQLSDCQLDPLWRFTRGLLNFCAYMYILIAYSMIEGKRVLTGRLLKSNSF